MSSGFLPGLDLIPNALLAPSGTQMGFFQPTAPLGWVAQTGAAYTDTFARVVSPGSYAGSGGVNGASGFLLGPYSVDGHAVTVAELPSHNHPDTGHAHGITQTPHAHPGLTNFISAGGTSIIDLSGSTLAIQQTATTGNQNANISVNVGVAVSSFTGSSATHTHTHTPNCKFIDHIVAVKS